MIDETYSLFTQSTANRVTFTNTCTNTHTHAHTTTPFSFRLTVYHHSNSPAQTPDDVESAIKSFNPSTPEKKRGERSAVEVPPRQRSKRRQGVCAVCFSLRLVSVFESVVADTSKSFSILPHVCANRREGSDSTTPAEEGSHWQGAFNTEKPAEVSQSVWLRPQMCVDTAVSANESLFSTCCRFSLNVLPARPSLSFSGQMYQRSLSE